MDFVKELIKERNALKVRLIKLEELLSSYGYNSENENVVASKQYNLDKVEDYSSDINFPEEGTYIEQILYVIKSKNRFVHNAEIAEELLPYSKYDLLKLKRRVSSVMTKAKDEIDSLVNHRFSNSKKDTVWGKKEWLNNDGSIKSDFMYLSKDAEFKKKLDF